MNVYTLNDVSGLLVDYKVGDTVSVKVARTAGREMKFYVYDITLVEYSPEYENTLS